MWFLDGRTVTDVVATGRPEPIPLEEWLDDPTDSAGSAADQLRRQLEAVAEHAIQVRAGS